MPSALTAARAALAEALHTRCAGEGVQFSYGPPDAYEDNEVVALMGVHDTDEEPAALGATAREERFSLRVGVKAYDPGETSAAVVDRRGLELSDIVRDVVAANPTLDRSVLWCGVEKVRSDGTLPATDGGWGIILFVDVACVTRI